MILKLFLIVIIIVALSWYSNIFLWVVITVVGICAFMAIWFILGISGSGTGEGPLQVLMRWIKEGG